MTNQMSQLGGPWQVAPVLGPIETVKKHSLETEMSECLRQMIELQARQAEYDVATKRARMDKTQLAREALGEILKIREQLDTLTQALTVVLLDVDESLPENK
jgi:hypothetical protein